MKPDYLIFSKSGKKKLVGYEQDGKWKVLFQLPYPDRFKPNIVISFEEIEKSKTRLTIEFSTSTFVKIYLAIWSILVSAISIAVGLSIDLFNSWIFIAPFGLSVFAVLIAHARFSLVYNSAMEYINSGLNQIKADFN
ncbi:MAG: hypothetical protein H6601_07345 [Flavobacteriales bacterium]|nr:hypothetical protein [Flavobacteriales bacterium]